ncbi:DUF1566 domain-containing protein [Wenzhouxiangella sp. XN79A]|uniref:Lcl C-terminal domain-containing protein n=1 Tax=Wenzhouxiangella sp. XN79A TaxID=2724193 RepID=UPI00144AE305|nr:DUF1566 domain-containing protein [Wenzhouxiangella sp. XN79A]NKI36329.1 DUF1566 domain-containing protein [Wenzhouxiangella sp. XN79A]
MPVRPVVLVISVLVLTVGAIGGSGPVRADESASDAVVEIDGLAWTTATRGGNLKWPDAVAYCETLELAGHSDWRLPTLDELRTLHDAEADEGIRSPFVIGDCCLWSGESLVDRPAEDGSGIAGEPGMYHWGFMFDGGFPYYAVHIFEDGRALCVREATSAPG